MDKSLLVRLFGFPALLVHGDPLVLDRWLWLRRRLPRTRNGERLIDIGCGTGVMTIGAALRGYRALGLSWDERNQRVAAERAEIVGAGLASFEVQDVRALDQRGNLAGAFEIAICFENIEHILDDRKLAGDIAACLKPGGWLLLTTPNYYYRPISPGDMGPFSKLEDGWHVRRGYTAAMLVELLDAAGLRLEEVSYCSGVLSQKLCALQRALALVHPILGWGASLPLRLFPPLFDRMIGRLTGYPYGSICVVAYKPRYRASAPRSTEDDR